MAKGAGIVDQLKKLDNWANGHRPLVLIGVVALTLATVALLNCTTGSDIFQQLFYPARKTVADVRFWSALVYALGFAMGLPVAFLLWHWRDRNVRDQIENARKDTNLKEFQEVQLRAAGAMDRGTLTPEACEQLQIAALHQIGAFARGDYGPSFIIPSIELLFSGHRAALERVGTPEEWANAFSFRTSKDEEWFAKIDRSAAKFKANLSHVDYARIDVIGQEWNAIRKSKISLKDRRFDLLTLREADFRNAICLESTFFSTDLRLSDFSGADLRYTKMQGAYLSEADFCGTNSAGQLFGAVLDGVVFDDATKLGFAWDTFDDERKTKCREAFKDAGARHVSEPPIDNPN